MTPEVASRIATWRQKALEGTLSIEDMKEAILAIREGRRGAATASEAARKRAKKEIKSAEDLLSELED